ncbi:MAG: alpha/beta fold hydrolase, partial [Candidatus Rokubacteria bacterium]|nr:alpha/beta fold hydrolase [Candidatus Rokubacteria bacterium]
NGVRLFFDVEGTQLVPDGPAMREKPTLLLLHGGPGFDHSSYKPAFSRFADVAQLVYLDHRGNGRSERGPTGAWNLAQWADDVRSFCEALGIEKPIVFGQSFGGMVAMAYAVRHPEHPSKFVFSSTSATHNLPRMLARFEEIGGAEARKAAEVYWNDPGTHTLPDYVRHAFKSYGATKWDPDALKRIRWNLEVGFHFGRGEGRTFDLRADLARVRCPTLVLGGALDPVCPIEDQEEIAAAIPRRLVRFERFESCGHGVYRDDPERGFAVIREFLLAPDA